MDLIADIGATNARCALLDARGRITRSESVHDAAFRSLEDVLKQFLRADGTQPERAALAIAAPVTGDEISMTNIGWQFSQRALEHALGVDRLIVVNDFEALAHALPRLGSEDCHRVGGGIAAAGATMAVLGPGTGLGVATAAPHGDGWTVVGGEGGHVSLPAMSEAEAAIIAEHADASGHCSAETLLSGSGLVRIYSALSRQSGRDAQAPTAAEVTDRALRGEELASRSYDLFFSMLGTVAGNLALTVGARGGIFIGGGIVPRVVESFERSTFRERFIAKGRYRDYLDAIPTSVILTEQPAFLGLKAVLGYG
jgi:glucokinase